MHADRQRRTTDGEADFSMPTPLSSITLRIKPRSPPARMPPATGTTAQTAGFDQYRRLADRAWPASLDGKGHCGHPAPLPRWPLDGGILVDLVGVDQGHGRTCARRNVIYSRRDGDRGAFLVGVGQRRAFCRRSGGTRSRRRSAAWPSTPGIIFRRRGGREARTTLDVDGAPYGTVERRPCLPSTRPPRLGADTRLTPRRGTRRIYRRDG